MERRERWLSLVIFLSFQRINFRGRRVSHESRLPLFGTIYFPTAPSVPDKAKPVHDPEVFRSAGHDVDPGCVDTGMTEYIRQFCNVFFVLVKDSCKQFPQIVRKDFCSGNTSCFTRYSCQPMNVKKLLIPASMELILVAL